MVQLTGQRGAEGAALYHRASSSTRLHHGAQAASVKVAQRRCGQAAARSAVVSYRGALEKRSKRGGTQGGRRVAASALCWERIEGGENRLGELRSRGTGTMGSARKRVRESKRSRLTLPVEEPKRNWPCLLQRWGEQERDGRWGKDLKRRAAGSLCLRQRPSGH
jgi:hypothetical protein